ncbi:hypothetical protein PDQ37_32260, partial [Bacillus cereus]|nr:hypothetical protein [Bacillus cereus]
IRSASPSIVFLTSSSERDSGVREMTDQATPNLPSRDFDSTAAFYERLGFGIVFRDAGWMILQRGDLMLEFFAHPNLFIAAYNGYK